MTSQPTTGTPTTGHQTPGSIGHPTTATTGAPVSARTAGRRPPAVVLVAAFLSVLAALVGGYGSVYFTGLEGWTGLAETYVFTYLAISLFGLITGSTLLLGRGAARAAARHGVAAYAVWLIAFSLFKGVRFAETEAAVFGVVGLVVLVLVLSRPARRWAG